jgi:phenylalanyl-tRNA synthetase beta subunit
LRAEIAQAGYDECLTLGLCSINENFKDLRRPYREGEAVVLANPKTEEFQICRTMLLPGILKTVVGQKSLKLNEGLKVCVLATGCPSLVFLCLTSVCDTVCVVPWVLCHVCV